MRTGGTITTTTRMTITTDGPTTIHAPILVTRIGHGTFTTAA
jgi:hypothetical protein